MGTCLRLWPVWQQEVLTADCIDLAGKCCALGEFLIKLWSMCITSTALKLKHHMENEKGNIDPGY